MSWNRQHLMSSLFLDLRHCSRLLEEEVSISGAAVLLNLPSALDARLHALGTLLSQLGYTPTATSSPET